MKKTDITIKQVASITLKPSAFHQFKYTEVRNKTWCFTCNIQETMISKKIAYAGGYGYDYDKVNACWTEFLLSYLLEFENKEIRTELRQKIEGGAFSDFNNFNKEKVISIFESLNLLIDIYNYKKQKNGLTSFNFKIMKK